MPFENVPSLATDSLALVLGLVVGSFLNVLALRSLSEESILWPPSKCPRCQHSLSALDNIPLFSYLWLSGKCRYCQGPISWQYPAVELFTALSFIAIERICLDPINSPFNTGYFNNLLISFLSQQRIAEVTNGSFDPNTLQMMGQRLQIYFTGEQQLGLLIGMGLLSCTLIAVTVTDFKEKLIPHEITYPSMIAGILFSALVRHDLLGALAGIGVSYIMFDFIAFYGLKVYLATHGAGEQTVRSRRLRRRLAPRKRRRLSSRLRWRLDLATLEQNNQQEEDIEVMGGGDAVLSAVMAAYLGWQLLIIALAIGFFVGTTMGMVLLLQEMSKAKLLHKCLRNAIFAAAAGATVFGLMGLAIDTMVSHGESHTALLLAVLGAASGLLMGVVSVGTRVSKPYPFGPALAAGGFIAMFLLPNWLSLH